jgi:hypothetical protein
MYISKYFLVLHFFSLQFFFFYTLNIYHSTLGLFIPFFFLSLFFYEFFNFFSEKLLYNDKENIVLL